MSRILMIDDDDDLRAACRLVLEKAGHEVSEAADADEGFEKVKAETPELVVLDVILPSGYEGFDLARRIREELNLRKLPILMLTGVHEVKKPPYRFAPDDDYLPVDAFLDKPVRFETLVRTVNEMLGLQRDTPEAPL